MNMRSWINGLNTLAPKKTMPVLSFPCVSLMGITVKELISSPVLMADGICRVADEVDSAAALSLMDLSVEAEAFGSTVRVSDADVPTVVGALVTTEEDAKALPVPRVGAGRTGVCLEAIGSVAKRINDRPVLAGVIGPFSLAGRLMDVTTALVNCYDEPDLVKATLERACEFTTAYIRAFREAGADGVVMAEPLTGLLSPDLAEEFSEPYVRRIVDACQTDSFAVIYHNCGGSAIRIIDSILRTGAAAYHFGNAISMPEMMRHIPPNVVAMGNIDPASQFMRGTPESIRKATLSLMSELCPAYPNFAVSSGCDIPPASPWENIRAYFAAVSEYYGK